MKGFCHASPSTKALTSPGHPRRLSKPPPAWAPSPPTPPPTLRHVVQPATRLPHMRLIVHAQRHLAQPSPTSIHLRLSGLLLPQEPRTSVERGLCPLPRSCPCMRVCNIQHVRPTDREEGQLAIQEEA